MAEAIFLCLFYVKVSAAIWNGDLQYLLIDAGLNVYEGTCGFSRLCCRQRHVGELGPFQVDLGFSQFGPGVCRALVRRV